MTTYLIPLAPVAKPRMSQRDKWRKRPCVVGYRDYCDALRLHARRIGFALPEAGARIVFRLPMPASWSKRKRAEMDGQPHQQTPDLDNMLKALADALLPEDSGLWQIAAEKRWAVGGAIEITVTAMERAA